MFIEDAVEECVVDVMLMNQPLALGGETEHRTHCHWFDNRAVRFAIVDSRSLCESTDNPPGLVAIEASIFFEFVMKDPFATDDVGTVGVRNEFPLVVGKQGIEFLLHRFAPVLIFECLIDGARDG